MQQYILFFDIDGTLFDCGHGHDKISEELKAALAELKRKGHLLFVASGRTFGYLNEDILSCNFDRFVISNGAAVIKDGEILLSHYFPVDIVKEHVANFKNYGAEYTLCDEYKAYIEKDFHKVLAVMKQFKVPEENIVTEFNIEDINVTKIEITQCNDEASAYIRSFKDQGFELIDYAAVHSFEYNLPNITKGKTILEVLDVLNIPVENSIAFGDGDNDIEMLSVVGHGVAMGNATLNAKKAANVVTESVVDEGIIKELRRIGLL